ncbi:hypothetical protein AAHA92_28882 [Salvia divinorum]|uniref:Uncharacterized protein n=1 Tax=Salvia divinorum TaxID=28513 RepID=A0ABD1FWJ4_SALDI
MIDHADNLQSVNGCRLLTKMKAVTKAIQGGGDTIEGLSGRLADLSFFRIPEIVTSQCTLRKAVNSEA